MESFMAFVYTFCHLVPRLSGTSTQPSPGETIGSSASKETTFSVLIWLLSGENWIFPTRAGACRSIFVMLILTVASWPPRLVTVTASSAFSVYTFWKLFRLLLPGVRSHPEGVLHSTEVLKVTVTFPWVGPVTS